MQVLKPIIFVILYIRFTSRRERVERNLFWRTPLGLLSFLSCLLLIDFWGHNNLLGIINENASYFLLVTVVAAVFCLTRFAILSFGVGSNSDA